METHHPEAPKKRSASDESKTPQKRYVESLKPNFSFLLKPKENRNEKGSK